MKNKVAITLALCIAFLCGIAVKAQGPMLNIDPHSHKNLAAAQNYIVLAYERIDKAQAENGGRLGGHAAQAKALLTEADAELRMAANAANQSVR